MSKKVLISVSDKTGLLDFAKELLNFGYDIISTGNTCKFLNENGIVAKEVSEVTGFDEILSGKVKTLHPKIFGGILADIKNADELNEIEKFDISPFDMVVVNLYPFEQNSKAEFETDEILKYIDIGGVALLRASAKNNKNVCVVSDIEDYKNVLVELKTLGEISPTLKESFAVKAFEITAKYDALIAKVLKREYKIETDNLFIEAKKIKSLRYGENPHQNANLYDLKFGLDYEILNGKEISYNNILDITSALNVVSEFYDVPACAIVKHTIPCGVALGQDIFDAYQKAFDCDSLSAFGGIIAFSQTVTREIAMHASKVFLEVLIAPAFDDEALNILKQKKNLRLIQLNTPLNEYKNLIQKEYKVTPFGLLEQDVDKKELDVNEFKVVTETKPNKEQLEDMIFAFKVAKHTKSNAIVIAKDFKAIAVSGGFTSRIDAVEWGLNHAIDGTKGAVLASDGFFPAIDNINACAQGRITAIIQPGGSIKDDEVIEQANKLNIAMVTTGIRHFRH